MRNKPRNGAAPRHTFAPFTLVSVGEDGGFTTKLEEPRECKSALAPITCGGDCRVCRGAREGGW